MGKNLPKAATEYLLNTYVADSTPFLLLDSIRNNRFNHPELYEWLFPDGDSLVAQVNQMDFLEAAYYDVELLELREEN